jgi:hypothetical protein
MKELRERGLYRLPDGAELIASPAARGGGYALFDQQVWKSNGLPDYDIDVQGRLKKMGESTKWISDDLIDTGQTVT